VATAEERSLLPRLVNCCLATAATNIGATRALDQSRSPGLSEFVDTFFARAGAL
jgi:hypothetical protein